VEQIDYTVPGNIILKNEEIYFSEKFNLYNLADGSRLNSDY
jgi:hypothetical protein